MRRLDRDGAQIIDARGPGEVLHAVAVGVEGEGDERLKPAALVLLFAEAQHVVDAMLEGLDVPVEHGGVGLHPEAVRDVVHLEVLLGGRLVVRDARAHVGVEDLGAAAGQASRGRPRASARSTSS